VIDTATATKFSHRNTSNVIEEIGVLVMLINACKERLMWLHCECSSG
jgi:hypothetical protein